MKTIIFLLIIIFLSLNMNIIYTQENNAGGDIFILNYSSKNIWVRVYPISIVFNADNNNNGNYDFHAMTTNSGYHFINGRGSSEDGKYLLSPNSDGISYNMEGVTTAGEAVAGIGRGIYRFEFFYDNINNLVDSAIVEWDAGYDFGDLTLLFNDEIEPAGIESYYFAGMPNPTPLPDNRKINCWSYLNRDKNYGNWVFDDIIYQNLPILPQDFRQNCGTESHIAEDLENEWRIGILTLNMFIKKDNIHTQDGEMLGAPHRIILTPGVRMTLDNNIDFTMKHNMTYENYYNILTVQENATLKLNPNSTINIENTNWVVFECHSNIILYNNAKIIFQNGSKFCNRGATMQNSGQIIFLGNIKMAGCSGIVSCTDSYIKDSVKFILENSSSIEIPDSTTYIFEGNETILKCKDSSKIKFGKGSKLVFEDGARINANNCKFVSYDTTETWDGIYLSGVSFDTLKNCTFQNALNGINVLNKQQTGFGSAPATEITDCVFKNSTSTELLNYVYVNNSNNVLIKGCSTEKTGTGGFTAGIIAEYCSAGGVVICDNNINYVNTGISLLQSSEYIARNVITGYNNTGTGIYLDNSNGTIEYNAVNNFQKSVFGSYSSPYLLKNTLIDAYITNIDLVNSSMPVMKPVISSSTLRWLGGNNTISGYPTNSGIRFADCYPLMDSGYNRIIVNGSDYLNGYFSMVIQTVNARINYWYDNPPNSSLFDITNGSAVYSNPFDGSSLPATDGTELNSIGWGLYDTVFTKTLGDNPTPEDLFTQAYTEEMSNNYTDAVNHYKEVVSSYKTSEYAPVSLARIFNCLEKSRANLSQYYAIQGYYTNIQNNSAYPNATRELSEDFKIKSKVKQYNTEEAIIDYDNIYQNNQNNPKGIHALINKLSLQKMTQSDAPNGSMVNFTEHKIGILSLITGKDLKNTNSITNNEPNQFRLYQNYPNPFNPTTSIKYEIPKNAQVIIKVYDILGKEIFSNNKYNLAGSYEVKFNGNNLASGMYFYSLEVNGYKDTKKMVLIK